MKPTILLALVAILFSFSACKDDANVEPLLSNPSMLIKSAIRYQDGKVTSTTTFEYDNVGRVTKITTNPNFYEKYNYVSDTMILVQSYNNEYNYSTDTLLLDSRGLVVADNHKRTFEYNTEGYLVKSTTMSDPVTLSNYEVWDGNILGSTEHQYYLTDTTEIQFVYTHEYLTTASNTIGIENAGKPFYGKQNKNLVSKTHLKRIYSDSDLEYDFTYSYQFDRYHRVTRQTQDNSPVSLYTVYTYND